MEPIEVIKLIFTAGFGAGISLFTTFLNNNYQKKRDTANHERNLVTDENKRKSELIKEYHQFKLSSIESVYEQLINIRRSATLTKSVIESSMKMPIDEFDKYCVNQFLKLDKLNAMVLARFPELMSDFYEIYGLFSQYWGYQRNVLLTNINNNEEKYRTFQKEIIRIDGEMGKVETNIKNKLTEIVNKLHQENAVVIYNQYN